jgi:predicted Zn finger-like uncharacterized protein
MFTVCPKCALTLVVTAADLRVAQGYVRCGRCSSVFNALAQLTDERHAASLAHSQAPGVDEPEEAPANPTQSTAQAPDVGDDLTDDALEFDPTRTDASAVFVESPPNPEWQAATGSFKSLIAGQEKPREPPAGRAEDSQVDVEMDADFLASMLQEPPAAAGGSAAEVKQPAPEPPARPATGVPRPGVRRPAETAVSARRGAGTRGESAAAPPPAQPTSRPPERSAPPGTSGLTPTARGATAVAGPTPRARHATPHTRPPQAAVKTPAPAPPPRAPSAGTRPAEQPQSAEHAATDRADLTAAEEAPDSTGRASLGLLNGVKPRAWTIGVVLGALLLVAQIINHDRDELAASSRFNRPLTALYSALGVQLTPHWDLHAYDVRQLGASVDPGGGGLITVRASIKNSARQAQPLPLLRVTLQDRFGNRIAARDVAPRFYLPRSMPASSFLSGGQRIDAQMDFVDPGANAVGFEIDACLPASGGGVACANDASAR